jgi:hypothetical protein
MHNLITYGLACISLLGTARSVNADPSPKQGTATISITVVDGLGNRLKGGEIRSFRDQKTSRDWSKNFHLDSSLDYAASGIPYGHYDLLVHQADFGDVEMPVDISRAEVFLEACMRKANVHIVALDSFGNPDLGAIKVDSFRDDANDSDLAGHFEGNEGTKIPYGIYELGASAKGSFPVRRRVDVFQPEVWVVIGLGLADALPEFLAPTWSLNGTIYNIPLDEMPLYVKLSPIYTDYSADAKVEVSGTRGTFRLAGADPWGKFALITIGKTGVLDIRVIDIRANSSVNLDLKQEGR